jgi:hypothetical protein
LICNPFKIPASGLPNSLSASPSENPAIATASIHAETLSAALIAFFTGTGSTAGRPKRKCTAAVSRKSNSPYPGPTAAFTGLIISPITYSGASCSSAANCHFAAKLPIRPKICSTSSECSATEYGQSPRVCPFQRATNASPCAISTISISSGVGSSKSNRRPESIRCQARGCFKCAPLFGPNLCRSGLGCRDTRTVLSARAT